jgi:TIR domain
MPSKPIFISHATSDKVLADKFVTLMEGGIGIPDRDVFCTSLEGLGIPAGEDFIQFIKGQIQAPKAVIILLTPHYFASQFCLCELGASWGMAHRAFPMLLPPLAVEEIKGILKVTQILRIHLKEGLNQFQDEISEALGIKPKAFAIWEKKRDEFLDWIIGYIKDYVGPDRVDPKAHSLLLKNYSDAKDALCDSESEIQMLKKQISKISLLKDTEQVTDIFAEDLTEAQQFNSLIENAKEKMEELPTVVNETLYYHFKREELPWPEPGYSNTDDKIKSIKDAVDSEFLKEGKSGMVLNEEDPLVSEALDALSELQSFTKMASSDFSDFYRNQYKQQLSFTNKRFWDLHL